MQLVFRNVHGLWKYSSTVSWEHQAITAGALYAAAASVLSAAASGLRWHQLRSSIISTATFFILNASSGLQYDGLVHSALTQAAGELATADACLPLCAPTAIPPI